MIRRLVKTNHYARLSQGGDPPVYVQNGHLYWENGLEVEDDNRPAWLDQELNKLTPEYRKVVGLPENPLSQKRR